ncbi:MAG: exopolyphosphatase/guanosine-5'-triphosphate,3'-diphosphate pyrophosphatase [Saprospiraceae bacterium]|jgi:exopolyphosphatase/guanosine-5'-triphosphate,3'-diphosphate pyrophosphatase
MNSKNTRFAAIDLGTNTFHLLVVEKGEHQFFKEIYRERRFVKLAEEGIGTIGEKPFQRGIQTLIDFKKKSDELGVPSVKLFGTAALRTASNGANFVEKIFEETGQRIQLISGQEEARLIHEGVGLAVPFEAEKSMIIDIGGGSVEFIIADKKQVYWAQSFPVGVAILFKQFHRNDPITEGEISAINTFLEKELQPLLDELAKHEIHTLLGASGAFEIAEIMLPQYRRDDLHSIIPIEKFLPLYQEMLASSTPERLALKGMPAQRVDLIIVAYLLINFVLQRTDIQQMAISKYAVKEGVLKEMMKTVDG